MHILVVEDDPVQADGVADVLSRLGYAVHFARDGESAIKALRTQPIDAVVLDWHLPKMSGIDVLNWIRNGVGGNYGVLLLTSRVEECDVVSALDAGADDYLTKPFRPDELAARMKALTRRSARNGTPQNLIKAGEYVLDRQSRTVSLHGQAIDFTPKEYDVAAALFNNLGKVMSRDMLAMSAWGREMDSRSLDTHVYRIRQKLQLRPENRLRLSSVYTVGYRLDETMATAANLSADRVIVGECV
ncbi:Alkaline phosphatase synthesis transcriptional regulatory protein PhoP [Paraburkholderia tropica]|uniref:response regulator transcription factor n=1 Tax=Paraburkholderia TaxID=1822464 RepID=UPI001CB2F452|nr:MULTISPECIES: response regulator transcription factor [Paraburkholderia]CAG9238581.1 Alkaline phosphatase synthesis transcriptional regulatory protein PhoP [Paraburkholderia tropica]